MSSTIVKQSTTIYDRLSGDSKMQVRYGLESLKGWLENTIVQCKSDDGSAQSAAFWLRKAIEEMENPIALENWKKLLAELEGISEPRS